MHCYLHEEVHVYLTSYNNFLPFSLTQTINKLMQFTALLADLYETIFIRPIIRSKGEYVMCNVRLRIIIVRWTYV